METYEVGKLFTRERPFHCTLEYHTLSEQDALRLCERLGSHWAILGDGGPLGPVSGSVHDAIVYEWPKLIVIVTWRGESPQPDGW